MPKKPHFKITWEKIKTTFGSPLLIVSVTYSQLDTQRLTSEETVVIGKIFEECLDDAFCRFVFWLAADFKIDRTHLDADMRAALRNELAKMVQPLTASQISQMNMRLNLFPDYLRAFYLEDYFDSMTKAAKKAR